MSVVLNLRFMFRAGMILLFLPGVHCMATEVDQFSHRTQKIAGIENKVDQMINEHMAAAAKKAKSCDRESLLEAVDATFNKGLIYPSIEREIGALLDQEKLPYKKFDQVAGSVYENVPFTIIGQPGHCGVCTHSVNLYGFEVGLDKIGHFFEQGYEYYDLAYPDPVGLRKTTNSALGLLDDLRSKNKFNPNSEANKEKRVLKFGDYQEKGTWGLRYNHIYSYGDLVANYEGYRFFQELFSGSSPYFKCVDNRWKQVRTFTFKDYLNHGFDESINCSSFSPGVDADLKKDIEKILKKQQLRETKCPVYPSLCHGVVGRYRAQADFLVHPDCIKAGGAQRTLPKSGPAAVPPTTR